MSEQGWHTVRQRARDIAQDLLDDAEAWCATRRAWWLRTLLLALLVYEGIRVLGGEHYRTFFGGIIFGTHELGHVLFSWAGQWVSIAAGTGTQVAFPFLAALHLLFKQRDYFGVSVCLCWLGFSLQDASVYIGDARAQALPLVGFGSHPLHDWHYLLRSMNLLPYDHALEIATFSVGAAVWLAGAGTGAWLCWQIRAAENASAPQ